MTPDLKLAAQVDPIDIGDVPGGMRADLRYTGGSLTIGSKDAGRIGQIIAGHDWILVRGDGLAIFDGRVTIAFDRYPAIARIEGRVRPQGVGTTQLSFARRARRPAAEAVVHFEVFMQFTVDSSDDCFKEVRELEENTYLGLGTYTFGDRSDTVNIDAYSTRALRTQFNSQSVAGGTT